MTISFPRVLPAVGYTQADFYPTDPYASSRSGRVVNVTQIKDPAWQVDLMTEPLRFSEAADVEAWWLSLRGGLRSCKFIHPNSCYPRDHHANQAPADDAGNLVSVASGNILTVDSVASGLSLVPGDRIGLEYTTLHAIGRVVEVSGAGTGRTIEIEPTPPPDVALATAVVRFASPELIMKPVRGTYKVAGGGSTFSVSFSLIESRT